MVEGSDRMTVYDFIEWLKEELSEEELQADIAYIDFSVEPNEISIVEKEHDLIDIIIT